MPPNIQQHGNNDECHDDPPRALSPFSVVVGCIIISRFQGDKKNRGGALVNSRVRKKKRESEFYCVCATYHHAAVGVALMEKEYTAGRIYFGRVDATFFGEGWAVCVRYIVRLAPLLDIAGGFRKSVATNHIFCVLILWRIGHVMCKN